MVRELHTVHGAVLMRLGALEESSASAANGAAASGASDGASDSAALRAELETLALKVSAFESRSTELSSALEGLRRVGDRLTTLDARDGEMGSKLAAIGQTMPVIAGGSRQCAHLCLWVHGVGIC